MNIAKVSYPGRSTEKTNFAILAIVDPIWIVTTPSGMEIFESQVADPISRPAWRYTIEGTPKFGSF